MIDKMKAMGVIDGGVQIIETTKPKPGSGEVRIKVIASAINPAEEKVIKGEITGRFLHAKSSPLIIGWDFAGTIDALGDDVTGLSEGTDVWGHLAFSPSQKQGTFAEYITISQNEIAVKPNDVPFHIAAAGATVAMTSLQSLRDLGKISEGKKVLVIGAGGGIGSISIGICKKLGAHVTGACSTKDVERVSTLGADEIVDRKKSDPFDSKSGYDIVFDTPAVYSFGRCSKILKSGGAYITTLPNMAFITGMVRALFSSKRCSFVQVASKRADLELVGKWLSDGLVVNIDSRYKIADLTKGLKRQNDSDRIGRVVVDVADGW